jgi:hypothetical protein
VRDAEADGLTHDLCNGRRPRQVRSAACTRASTASP